MPSITLGKKLFLLVTVLAATFIVVLNSTAINIAMPYIASQFDLSIGLFQWISSSYLLAMAGFAIALGRISESTGRIRLLAAGLVVFTLGSLACGFSGSTEQLILFRTVQGLGASAVAVAGIALLFEVFSPGWAATAMGCLIVVTTVSSWLASLLGGFMVSYAGWQSVFFVSATICIGLVLCTLACFRIPEARSRQPIDWIGLALLTTSAVTLMLAFLLMPGSSGPALISVACAAVSVLSFIAFLYLTSRGGEKWLFSRDFAFNKLLLPLLSMAILIAVTQFVLALAPTFFIDGAGLKPKSVSALLAYMPLAMLIPAVAGGLLYDGLRWRYVAVAGVLTVAAGCLILGYAVLSGTYGLALYAFVAIGAGCGLFGGQNSVEILRALPGGRSATASGILTTVRNLAASSIALGFALLSTGLRGSSLNTIGVTGQSIGAVILAAGGLCLLAALFSVPRNA